MPDISALNLKDEALPSDDKPLSDLPEFGGGFDAHAEGDYIGLLPPDLSSCWEVFDFQGSRKPGSKPGQRVTLRLESPYAITIIQGPGGQYAGEGYKGRLSNAERWMEKSGVEIRDLDYLLAAAGSTVKPKSNSEYIQQVNEKCKGLKISFKNEWSARCNPKNDIRQRVQKAPGQFEVVTVPDKKGCDARYYSSDIMKDASGKKPENFQCGKCGAWLRVFDNLVGTSIKAAK